MEKQKRPDGVTLSAGGESIVARLLEHDSYSVVVIFQFFNIHYFA
jgi:hypothetical protein